MNIDDELKDEYPFESHFIDVSGGKYHFVDEGSGDPIVMVHGNPTWSFYYRNLIKEFSQTNRVICPDHLGCGLSDKPQDYSYRLEAHIDNLEQLLMSFDLRNITLIVHDWGGAIGMGFAIRHTTRIKSIIILNTAAFSINTIPFRISLCRIPFLGPFMVRYFNAFAKAATFMTTVKKLSNKIKKGFLLPYDNYENRVAVNAFIQDIPMTPDAPSYEVLIEIEHGLWMFREIPVCIIWGMQDWCFSKVFLERWLVYFPQANLLKLEKAGHYLLEDANSDIISYIKRFFWQNDLQNKEES